MIALRDPLAICGAGALMPVGRSAAAVCAAMRARIDGFCKTSYLTVHGERIVGAPVPGVKAATFGIEYVAALAAPALAECLAGLPADDRLRTHVCFGTQTLAVHVDPEHVAAELKAALAAKLQLEWPVTFSLELIPQGEMSFAHGLIRAAECLVRNEADYTIVGGAETYLSASRLRSLDQLRRLKTGRNTDGLIPGEGSSFVAIAGARHLRTTGTCLAMVRSLAIETEQAAFTRMPNRGEAWTRTIQRALADARLRPAEIGFRPVNFSGERLVAIEEGIALMRCFLEPMPLPPAWYVAGSVGTVGAGVGALLALWATAAFQRGYAVGDVALCQLHANDGQRAAFAMTPAQVN